LKYPVGSLRKFALALALTCFLTPNVKAASDSPNEVECQKLLEEGQVIVSGEDKANGHHWVKAKILINASPHVVWETVHDERRKDPDLAYSKVLETNENHVVLEQKFCLLPLIGTATCVMNNHEIQDERIDYDMASSDHFKALEGSWVLTPDKGTQSTCTYLELSSYLDMGLPVPRPMLDAMTAKKLQRRLSNVKAMAEAAQFRIAHNR
jgi:Polyketide cyclase / dehydrase and lipid transport